MKSLFDQISYASSKMVTKAYSTSFSLGILFLDKEVRKPIYNIYGFVRFADEIVDSFQGYDKENLLARFKADTITAIEEKISLNPILNSFQEVVHQYNIPWELIDCFLHSMEMDLKQTAHDSSSYSEYIYGSAEVVGLMCLKVFVNGDEQKYDELLPYAKRLGSAFQKVNFLRDVQDDYVALGRTYFPGVNMANFNQEDKAKVEEDISIDFKMALEGILKLPMTSRKGVYLAYFYYLRLFKKIKRMPAAKVLEERVRIPNPQKIVLMFNSLVRHQLNCL